MIANVRQHAGDDGCYHSNASVALLVAEIDALRAAVREGATPNCGCERCQSHADVVRRAAEARP